MKPQRQSALANQEGFTLVEIIAVLIILGILAAVAVPRYIDLEANARDRAIDAAISELNGRENLHWANIKIGAGWETGGDSGLFTSLDKDLGGEYDWATGDPTTAGGDICFKCEGAGPWITLYRRSSATDQPGLWSRDPFTP